VFSTDRAKATMAETEPSFIFNLRLDKLHGILALDLDLHTVEIPKD